MVDSATENDGNGEAVDDISELIDARRRIEGWLDRLDDQSGSASREVLERVRADYRQRLEEITEKLLRRQDVVSRWLSEAEERVGDAAERRAAAAAELEEGRLRHQIGEWTDEHWDQRRVALEGGVQAATTEENEARGDIHRLRQLLGEAGGRKVGSPPRPTALPAQPREAPRLVSRREPPDLIPLKQTDSAPDERSATEDLDAEAPLATEESAAGTEAGAPIDSPAADSEAEDVTLIPEDPSPAVDGQGSDGIDPDAAGEFDPETIPKPGIKCGNCGYTNDAAAWFCGVCGADIG